jgi:hypothetical protein
MSAAALFDIAVYGVHVAVGLAALRMIGRYYGRKKPPKPDDTTPKDK